MMIMPANNKSGIVHYFAGKYPDKIGLLISPDGWIKGKPPFYMSYALDNGAFTGFSETSFFLMLSRAKLLHSPLWVVCPDVVGDCKKTLENWYKYSGRILDMGFKLAFACQDGCLPSDVPEIAECCFIGGSTEWKLNNAHKFKGRLKLLHIGRVNSLSRIEWAERIGADSVDGTGFFRSRDKQYNDFIEYFIGKKQKGLFNGL